MKKCTKCEYLIEALPNGSDTDSTMCERCTEKDRIQYAILHDMNTASNWEEESGNTQATLAFERAIHMVKYHFERYSK